MLGHQEAKRQLKDPLWLCGNIEWALAIPFDAGMARGIVRICRIYLLDLSGRLPPEDPTRDTKGLLVHLPCRSKPSVTRPACSLLRYHLIVQRGSRGFQLMAIQLPGIIGVACHT